MQARLSPPSRRLWWAVGAVLGAVSVAIGWGFTVDDALIIARYAHHIATGVGYRMNAGGAVTDGVTPLGYAYLLAPFAGTSALGAFAAARSLGAVAWCCASGFLLQRLAQTSGPTWRLSSSILLFASPSLACWASAGMETGLVVALIATAAAWGPERPWRAAALLTVAAALRPELTPLALGLAAKNGHEVEWLPRPRLLQAALVLCGVLAVAVLRAAVFGRPLPLSAVAKPADVWLGLSYATANLILLGPLCLLAPLALFRASALARRLTALVALHLGAVALAGGDWMPLGRLCLPALPIAVLAMAELAQTSSRGSHALRLSVALAAQLFVWKTTGWRARDVLTDRRTIIDELVEPLRNVRHIATLDIGFVGVAAPHARVTDLAGVTDPMVAVLPGSHTQKRIPDGMLAQRNVDALLLQLGPAQSLRDPWHSSGFARGVERFVALEPGLSERFEPSLVTQGKLRYVLLRREE